MSSESESESPELTKNSGDDETIVGNDDNSDKNTSVENPDSCNKESDQNTQEEIEANNEKGEEGSSIENESLNTKTTEVPTKHKLNLNNEESESNEWKKDEVENKSVDEDESEARSQSSSISDKEMKEDKDVNENRESSKEQELIDNIKHLYPGIEISRTRSDIIQEGKAKILKQSNKVFYNPVQEFNRDISVAAISVFSEEHRNDPRSKSRGTKRKANNDKPEDDGEDESKVDNDHGDGNDGINVVTALKSRTVGVKYDDGIVILEALSATGLRSIRYAKEVPGVKEVVANDISVAAVESIKKNIEYNSCQDIVVTSHNDASLLMYIRKAKNYFFDVVDLDPYGCPSRFLDSAVQCVKDGGLLLVTCTDMAVLAGNSPETCYVKYGAVSLRNPACHEMALRIALQCIESHANRYGRYIVPQISFSADFYIRVIVKVFTSPAMCKRTTSKLSMIYQCAGCQSFNYWPLGLAESENKNMKYSLTRGPPTKDKCSNCNSTFYQAGPIWSAPLHNLAFIDKLLVEIFNHEFVTEKRIEGLLELIKEELPQSLLYYTIDSLCSKVHCEVVPRNKLVSAILHAGYKVSLSHAAPNSVKTNAPSGVIWDIIRCWVQEHPVNPKRLSSGSVAERILTEFPRFNARFDLHPMAIPNNRKKLLRYQRNPQPFWGPGTRHKANEQTSDNRISKSYANQNKKFKRYHLEKQKAEMKKAINSKNIDIIEVVTLTDDEDDVSSTTVSCDNNINDNNPSNFMIAECVIGSYSEETDKQCDDKENKSIISSNDKGDNIDSNADSTSWNDTNESKLCNKDDVDVDNSCEKGDESMSVDDESVNDDKDNVIKEQLVEQNESNTVDNANNNSNVQDMNEKIAIEEKTNDDNKMDDNDND